MTPDEEREMAEARLAVVKKMYEIADSDVPIDHLNYLASYASANGGPFSSRGQEIMIIGLNVLLHIYATDEHKRELDRMTLEIRRRFEGDHEDCSSCDKKDTCDIAKIKQMMDKVENELEKMDAAEKDEKAETPIPDYILRAFEGPLN